MRKKVYVFIYQLFLILLLSGCSLFEGHSSLLTPPSLNDQQAELKTVISKYLPDQAEMLTPLDMKEAQSIFLEDLDGDGQEEMIVFYKMTNRAESMKGIVLKKKDKVWKKIAEFDGTGFFLSEVQFVDLNNNGRKEIVAGFRFSEELDDKGLLVYDIFSDDSPKLLLDKPYTYVVIDDFQQQKNNELVLIKFDRNSLNKMVLYRYAHEQMTEIATLELDPYVDGYLQAISGLITKNQKGIFLDGYIGAHSGFTNVITINNDTLTNVFDSESEVTFKPYATKSEDINGDGILEISLPTKPISKKERSYAETPYYETYYQLTDQFDLQAIARRFFNYEFLYEIQIPATWPDQINIERSEDNRYIKFIDVLTNEVLFDIYATEKEKEPIGSEWHVLTETSSYLYISKTANKDTKQLFQLYHPYDQ
ncbi:hypothetical protein [Bacillus chungangensis]|uniref:Lipoprotein n=1 Tax=Bacillus chungangensis TaxID=587633 RepID=A0ABT9WQE0_9BACI|nr:hypothetical protein [Bacillus chungangensis]MDQ0175496.1 hypothetical protein [Bacillus chungangensis]